METSPTKGHFLSGAGYVSECFWPSLVCAHAESQFQEVTLRSVHSMLAPSAARRVMCILDFVVCIVGLQIARPHVDELRAHTIFIFLFLFVVVVVVVVVWTETSHCKCTVQAHEPNGTSSSY